LLHKAPPSQLLVDVCRFVGRVSTLHLSRHQRYNNHRSCHRWICLGLSTSSPA
jgi:hypothetical protein